jgi:hypothetical protein
VLKSSGTADGNRQRRIVSTQDVVHSTLAQSIFAGLPGDRPAAAVIPAVLRSTH